MKARPQTKEVQRPLRSSSKVPVKTNSTQNADKKNTSDPSTQDHSILKKSVETSISSPLDVIKIFENGTSEIIELLKSECFVILECKVCRNLFRSVANFITHKRSYCVGKFTSENLPNSKNILEHALLVGCNKGNSTSSRKTSRRDIISLLDSFVKKNGDSMSQPNFPFVEINNTSSAIYNYHPSKEANNDVAIVNSEGRVIGITQENGQDMTCRNCNKAFHSADHLSEHSKICQRIVKQTSFGCPCCSKFFTTAWGVYRHLRKVHGKTSEQVRKLKMSILKREKKSMDAKSKPQPPPPPPDMHQTNKMWMEEYEYNGAEVNKCFICGRQFERRVALISHTVACQKRKMNMVNLLKRRPSSPRTEGEKKSRIEVRMFYDKPGMSKACDISPEAVPSVSSIDSCVKNSPSQTNDTILIEDENEDSSKKRNFNNDRSSSDEGVDSPTIPCSPELCETTPLVNGLGSMSPEPPEEDTESLPGREENQEECFNRSEIDLDQNQDSIDDRNESDKLKGLILNGHLSPSVDDLNGNDLDNSGNICDYGNSQDDEIICEEIPYDADAMYESETSSLEQEIENKFSTDPLEDNSSGTKLSSDFEGSSDLFLSPVKSKFFPDMDPVRLIENNLLTPPSESKIFESESPEDELPDSPSPINMYICRRKNSCLICGKVFSKLSLAIRDVALHLGIARYRCAINSCAFKCYAKFDIQKHILLYHKIKKCNLFILNIPKDEIFSDDEVEPDFYGFETPTPASPPQIYKQFLEEVTDDVQIETEITSEDTFSEEVL